MIESATVHKNFLGDHKNILLLFSYDFGVSDIVHFLLFEVPYELCHNEERYYNKPTPPPPTHFKGPYFILFWERSPWKNDISPWKVLDFFPKTFVQIMYLGSLKLSCTFTCSFAQSSIPFFLFQAEENNQRFVLNKVGADLQVFISSSNNWGVAYMKDIMAIGKRSQVARLVCEPSLVILLLVTYTEF